MPTPEELRDAKKKILAAKKKLREQERQLDSAANQTAYGRHKETTRQRQVEITAAGREIGEPRPPKNPERRARGLIDPTFFLREYFPNRFYLQFGQPHHAAIGTIEYCARHGGLHAVAMMRGGGKTSIAEPMALWAILYGLRRYMVIIGATDDLASTGVRRIFRELETNDILNEDFAEVTHPIRCLERIMQRCKGQTMGGEPTAMENSDGHFVFPTWKESRSSGSVIQAFGITGSIKGLNRLAPNGEPIRPDLVLIDDAQTRESAGSPTQTATRERIICDDVLGLAGPQVKMAAVLLCTPIYENDLTERFIDRERHPEWGGVRTRMVEAMPMREDLWDTYAEMRRDGFRSGDRDTTEAQKYYTANRAEMDAGCKLAWPDRVKDGDVSAIQSAMNLKFDNPTGFASEYQCEPLRKSGAEGMKTYSPAAVASRLSGNPQFAVPPDCTRLTAFVDCGGELLWYAVVAWTEKFGGSVIDYGAWPKQSRSMFAANDPKPGMSAVFPNYTEEQRVYAGLSQLVPSIVGKPYFREGQQEMRVERCLIDSGWKPGAVYDFCRSSPLSSSLYPSKGVGRSTSQVGVARWKARPGERSGPHWRLTVSAEKRGRSVQFDPDAWKTFIYGAFAVPIGGGTALTLFGKSAGAHELFAEHISAEYSEPATTKGDTYDKWNVLADRSDNHLLDCIVGCAVAASVQGLGIPSTESPANLATPAAPKVKLSDLQKQKRGAKT